MTPYDGLAVIALMAFTAFLSALVVTIHYERKLKSRYAQGLHDGARISTVEAERLAVNAYKMELHRKLTERGRRHPAHPDAPPARVHKVRVGPAPTEPGS